MRASASTTAPGPATSPPPVARAPRSRCCRTCSAVTWRRSRLMADVATARPALGTYQLFVPWDWVDLLADPDGETALRTFEAMAAELYPTLDAAGVTHIATRA